MSTDYSTTKCKSYMADGKSRHSACVSCLCILHAQLCNIYCVWYQCLSLTVWNTLFICRFFFIFIYMSFLQPRVTYSFVLRFLSFPYFCLKLYSRRNKNLSDVKNTEGHSVMNAESSRYPPNQTTKCRGTDAEFISEIRSHVMMTPLPWIWKVSVQYFASLLLQLCLKKKT